MKKVLVVDDTAFMRHYLKTMLESNNYKVVGEAENGLAAVLKYKELKPDLVTMDITMPKMNGLEALKLIKEFDPDSKVVMVSAMGQESYVKEAVKSGANAFIVKPFKDRFIFETLRGI